MVYPYYRPRIERVESLLKKVRAFAAAAAAATSFAQATSVIWRPGGVTAGNVYATWPEVVAAVAAVNGYVTIGVDVDLAPAVIPAGAWDLRPAGVSGPVELVNASKTNSAPFVTIANAAVTIHGLTGIQDVQVNNQSTSNVITVTAANQVDFYMRGFSALYQSILSGAAVSFFNMTAGSLNLYMQDGAFISTLDGGSLAIRATGGTLQIFIEDSAALDANMLSVGVGVTTNVFVSSTSFAGFAPYQTQPAAAAVIPLQMVVRGTATIDGVTGKTLAIPAFITANSRILVTLKTPVGDAATAKGYAALSGDRVNGNPGSFKISALTAVGGGDVNAADASTVDWEVATTS